MIDRGRKRPQNTSCGSIWPGAFMYDQFDQIRVMLRFVKIGISQQSIGSSMPVR